MSIKIDLKIFLFLFLFLLTSQLEIYLLLMVLAILHELGHLIAGILLKFEPEEIKLTPVGLQISFKVNYQDYSEQAKALTIKKAIIALAGPLTNLGMSTATILFAVIAPGFANTYWFSLLLYSNLLIALFNLLPIYPLDGGRFLKEILKLGIGKKKANKITYLVSKTMLVIITAISSIVILYLQNIAILIIIAYLWYLEILEIRKYNRRKNIEKLIQSVEKKEHSSVSCNKQRSVK